MVRLSRVVSGILQYIAIVDCGYVEFNPIYDRVFNAVGGWLDVVMDATDDLPSYYLLDYVYDGVPTLIVVSDKAFSNIRRDG